MIVVDSSAIVAIWQDEADAEALKDRLLDEPESERCVSATTYVEAGSVFGLKRPSDPLSALRELEQWIENAHIEIVSFDDEQARIALDARIRFGRGFGHPAKLNFGDCFSYALAKTLRAPLLYTGADFEKTGIRSALRKKTRKK